MSYYIGIIGDLFGKINKTQEGQLFSNIDTNKLESLLDNAVNEALQIKEHYQDDDGDENIYIVIGIIDKGINRLAFDMARERGWKTIGIDSIEARIYDVIEGINQYIYIKGGFGIENKEFVKNIDVLINIHGSSREQEKEKLARKEKKPVIGVK